MDFCVCKTSDGTGRERMKNENVALRKDLHDTLKRMKVKLQDFCNDNNIEQSITMDKTIRLVLLSINDVDSDILNVFSNDMVALTRQIPITLSESLKKDKED